MDNAVTTLITGQRRFFGTMATRPIPTRIQALKKLKRALIDWRPQLLAALHADLRKSECEAILTELLPVVDEINSAIRHLKKWAKPQSVSTPLLLQPGCSFILSEPRGIVFIIGTWNYPLQLMLSPLVGALAAGNCVILKPSENAPATAQALAGFIKDTFPVDYVTVCEGGPEITQHLLRQPIDYIFFTGGIAVGKLIMAEAAKQLTPITLELGGKSPCIVSQHADLRLAAKRIVWGKFLNAGQTCVAPDYVFVHSSISKMFADHLCEEIRLQFGSDPLANSEYGRIINERQFRRLESYLTGAAVIHGGRTKPEGLLMEPTLVMPAQVGDPLMQEEIFGPILPIVPYENFSEVCSYINLHPTPLALYLFSNNTNEHQRVYQEIAFGGGCINDTVLHLANGGLPFGGVGASGIGSYHGKAGFDLFSHRKSILKKARWFDPPLRYAPYQRNLKWLRWLLQLRSK